MDRAKMKSLFWSRVPESIEGYSGRIQMLLDELTDEQLERVIGHLGIEDESDSDGFDEYSDPKSWGWVPLRWRWNSTKSRPTIEGIHPDSLQWETWDDCKSVATKPAWLEKAGIPHDTDI